MRFVPSRVEAILSLLCLFCVFLGSDVVESFQVGSKHSCRIRSVPETILFNDQGSLWKTQKIDVETSRSRSVSSMEVSLLKKKKDVVEEEPTREENNGIQLFFLYMTPWKNPNSIFVYMLGLLYCLGKYSEAQSIARMSGGI